MPTAVIDASAVADWLARATRAPRLDLQLDGLDLVAPEIMDVEVLNGVRRWERLGAISAEHAAMVVDGLVTAPIERFRTTPLLHSAWLLRHNLTAYEAVYVALARVLDCPLVTSDRRLTRAPDLGITTIVV
ncbi:MAG: type II toxin-antitoxin system VapC family toxin [Acidimicrobiales bacterium]